MGRSAREKRSDLLVPAVMEGEITLRASAISMSFTRKRALTHETTSLMVDYRQTVLNGEF